MLNAPSRPYTLPPFLWHNVPMPRHALESVTARRLNRYIRAWLGTRAESEQQLVSLVEGGLPTKTVNRLIERGLSRKEVFDIIIPLRTWKHRKSRHQPLSKEESERAVRAARILARAQAVLGDETSALNWLRAPKRRFENRAPLQMLGTETGGRLVEQMLIQIDEGMFA
jgi:putative toxin-antitoxin system antitoxin component (TIGR02293 family)